MKNKLAKLRLLTLLVTLSSATVLMESSAHASALVAIYEYFDGESKWKSSRSGVPTQRTEGELQRIIVGFEGSLYGSYQFGDLEGKSNNPFNEKYKIFELGVDISNRQNQHLFSRGQVFGRYSKIEYSESATGNKAGDEEYYTIGYRSSNYYQIFQNPLFKNYQIFAGPGLDGELNIYYTDASRPVYDPTETGYRKYGLGGNLRPFFRLGLGDQPRGNARMSASIDIGYQYSYFTNFDQTRRFTGMNYRAGLKISY